MQPYEAPALDAIVVVQASGAVQLVATDDARAGTAVATPHSLVLQLFVTDDAQRAFDSLPSLLHDSSFVLVGSRELHWRTLRATLETPASGPPVVMRLRWNEIDDAIVEARVLCKFKLSI